MAAAKTTRPEDLKRRDRLVNFISADKQFRASLVKLTASIHAASQAHNLNPLTRLFLGQLMVSSQLVGAHLTGEQTISLKVNCTGPLQGAVAETNGTGEIRAYVQNPGAVADGDFRAELSWQAIGEGDLSVQKWLRRDQSPSVSIVPLLYRNLAKDLTWYFFQSEQVNTAVKIEINLSEKLEVTSAFGLMVQALPGAKDESSQKIEAELAALASIQQNLGTSYFDTFFESAFTDFGFRETYRRALDFFCRCSKKSFAVHLQALPADDLLEMAADGTQEIVCHYCAEKYYFTPEELKSFVS